MTYEDVKLHVSVKVQPEKHTWRRHILRDLLEGIELHDFRRQG